MWLEGANKEEKIAKQALAERRRQQLETLKAQFRLSDPDPILTFPLGQVRVLVAQYGKWPVELQALQTALKEDLRSPLD